MHLISAVDRVRYVLSIVRLYRSNAKFVRQHPEFALPPKQLAFDAHAEANWQWYRRSGEETAQMVAQLIQMHSTVGPEVAVLDWGCGPGRVVRHLPAALGPRSRVTGSDYNPESISWCRAHIPNVTFIENDLEPPLPFAGHSFDCIYAQSVFTHLSVGVSQAWATELRRVLKPEGLLIVSTNGDALAQRLLPEEQALRQREGVVIRGLVREGKKMFGAYHTPQYVRGTLLRGYEVVEHRPEGFLGLRQDLWVARVR